MIDDFRKKLGCAVVMVSHSMDDIAKAADRVVIMREGSIFAEGTPSQVFCRAEELKEMGLDAPFASLMAAELRRRGVAVNGDVYTVDALVDEIKRLAGRVDNA